MARRSSPRFLPSTHCGRVRIRLDDHAGTFIATGIDSSSRAAIAFIAPSGTFAVTTAASPVPMSWR